MRNAGKKIIAAAEEALSIAKGEKPAAAIWHNGNRYVPDGCQWRSRIKDIMDRGAWNAWENGRAPQGDDRAPWMEYEERFLYSLSTLPELDAEMGEAE